jgi:hypothetical protein
MKRILATLAVLSLVVAVAASAHSFKDGHEGHAHGGAAKAEPKSKAGSWTGEILDAGCYLGHGAMGEKHKGCAVKCAANGMPLMLLTADGKALLLTPPHDDTEGYEKAKSLAGTTVTITGTLNERGGVKGLEVTACTPAK